METIARLSRYQARLLEAMVPDMRIPARTQPGDPADITLPDFHELQHHADWKQRMD